MIRTAMLSVERKVTVVRVNFFFFLLRDFLNIFNKKG